MLHTIDSIINEFKESARLKTTFVEQQAAQILQTAAMMSDALRAGGKLLICGNGGSAADAQHFAAEMIGRLVRERRAIPAVALTTDSSILTAVANDYSINEVFRRQVEGLGKAGDVLLAVSTSGNSENVVQAVQAARTLQMTTIGLLGKNGGRLASLVDAALIVPSTSSQRIQEVHITVIHTWCGLIEDSLYPKMSNAEP